MLVFALWLSSAPAEASCSPPTVEVRPLAGAIPPVSVERRTWEVGPGWPDCVEIRLPSPLPGPIEQLRIEHVPFERKARVLDTAQRVVHGNVATSGGADDRHELVVHVPELQHGDRLVIDVVRKVADSARVGETAAAAGTAGVPDQESQALLTLLPLRKPLRGLAQDGESWTAMIFQRQGAQPARQTVPLDGQESWCTLLDSGTPCESDGLGAWGLPAEGRVAWGYLLPRADASGRAGLAPAADSSFTWLLPEGEVAVDAARSVRLDDGPAQGIPSIPGLAGVVLPEAWVTLLSESAPLTRQVTARARDLSQSTPVLWRLTAVDGAPALVDGRAAEQAVAWLAIRASMPEPSLPNALRGLNPDPDEPPHSTLSTVGVMLAELVHPGRLPGARDLFPRRLMKVRDSGWASPWEHALVVARALVQLKFEAIPIPVRPRALGEPDPGSLADWPLAVVVVRHAQGAVVIDPGCQTCDPGQLRPELDGAWVLSPGVEALPTLPPSSLLREIGGEDIVLTVEGPLALSLRERMASRPAEERAGLLAGLLIGPGATLVEHDGLVRSEAAIRLRFRATEPPAVPLADLALFAGPARGRFTEVDREGQKTELVVEEVDEGTAAWVRLQLGG